jgi:hypothetical protein
VGTWTNRVQKQDHGAWRVEAESISVHTGACVVGRSSHWATSVAFHSCRFFLFMLILNFFLGIFGSHHYNFWSLEIHHYNSFWNLSLQFLFYPCHFLRLPAIWTHTSNVFVYKWAYLDTNTSTRSLSTRTCVPHMSASPSTSSQMGDGRVGKHYRSTLRSWARSSLHASLDLCQCRRAMLSNRPSPPLGRPCCTGCACLVAGDGRASCTRMC